jgi:hypothetical protein
MADGQTSFAIVPQPEGSRSIDQLASAAFDATECKNDMVEVLSDDDHSR